MGGQWYDANISIPGCDKNMPGVIMGECIAFCSYRNPITNTCSVGKFLSVIAKSNLTIG